MVVQRGLGFPRVECGGVFEYPVVLGGFVDDGEQLARGGDDCLTGAAPVMDAPVEGAEVARVRAPHKVRQSFSMMLFRLVMLACH